MKQKHTKGYFVFSLDTELAWGYFDKDEERAKIFSKDGQRERDAIRRVLALCEEYGIRATWALVGHLLHPNCEGCKVCPVLNWKDRYDSFESIYETDHSLWYAPEIVKLLTTHKDKHEIAFHGYTHEVFSQMDTERAQYEIEIWKKMLKEIHLETATIIFPRNVVAHLKHFKTAGFKTFRSMDSEYPVLPSTRIGALFKVLDYLLAISRPRIYDIDELPIVDGLLDVSPSAYLFDFNRRIELGLDYMGLYLRRLRRVICSIDEAANQKKIVHIWAHPWEFRTEKDFLKLEYILESAAQHIEQGSLRSVTMSEISGLV